MAGNDASPTLEQWQDLLLESPGFTDFLLGLTTISASLLGGPEPMLFAITVERDSAPATVASSTDVARRLDEKQYAFDDGPCLTALRQQRQVLIEDLSIDERWERYAREIAAEGIRSVLAVPIEAGGSSRAALNCYAPGPCRSTRPWFPRRCGWRCGSTSRNRIRSTCAWRCGRGQ
jgi:GAF domain-containing protein